MIQKSVHSAHDVKVFSDNHRNHTIVLSTDGVPSKETGCELRAVLNKKELEKVCDLLSSFGTHKEEY